MSLRASFLAPVAFAISMPSALAGEPMQAAAEECADAIGGWLSCQPSSSPDELDCGCTASARGKDAYFVKVDSDTTTAYFDGKLLVARDFADEQSTVRVSLFIDDRTAGADFGADYDAFLNAYDATVAGGAPNDLAAETAAERSGITAHEMGHNMGMSHDSGG